MKKTALRSCSLAFSVALIGSFVASLNAQTTTATDPVGFVNLTIQGASDNVMSLPMVRDAVFSGSVAAPIAANSFNVMAGQVAPGWTASQFKYAPPAQTQTFYAEFTTGALKGLYYKIDDNGTGSLTLDTEGDSLLLHPLPGAPNAALAVGDNFKIRPYFRVKDVFEVSGQPVIDPAAFPGAAADDILIPNYTTVDINKAPNVIIYYLAGVGWQKAGNEGQDFGNFVLRPNEAFVVRRRNAQNLTLTNLGGVLMNSQISFLPGGSATKGNDTYFSLNRPASVSLDASGLSAVVTPSPAAFDVRDQVLAFPAGTGFNRAPSQVYYFLAGQPAGQGWRKVGDDNNLTIGQTVMVEPGKVYVLRKLANTPGADWVNNPNY